MLCLFSIRNPIRGVSEGLLRLQAHDLESNLTTMSRLAACILGQQMYLA